MLRALSMAVASLGLWLSQVTAAEPSLPVKLPASTGAIIKLASPESTLKKVAEAADGLQQGWGNLVSGQSASLGALISNPTLAGVDKTKDWYVAVYPYAEDEPGILFIIPFKDGAEMEEAIPESYEFIKGDGYGFYTEDEEVAKEIKAAIKGEGDLLKLSPGKGMEILTKSHLSFYLNIPVLMETYQAAWDEGVEAMLDGFDEGLQQAEGSGVNIEEIAAIFENGIHLIEQALADSEAFQFGLLLDDQGIKIQEFLSVEKDTETHKYLLQHGPTQPKLLSRLPAEQLLYFCMTGAGDNPLGNFMKEGVKFNQKMLELSEEKIQNIDKITESLQDFKFLENSLSLGLGDLETGVIRVSGLFDMSPANKWCDILSGLCTAIGDIDLAEMKQSMSYEKAVETIGNNKIDLFKVIQEHSDENINQMQKQIMSVAYGPDGNVNRFTVVEKNLLQTIGGGQEGMSLAINAHKKNAGFEAGSASKRDRGQIQENINMLFMIDLAGIVKEGLTLGAQSGNLPLPIDVEALDKLKLERSYLSVGVSCEESGLHCLTNIPILQIKNGVNFGMSLQKMMSQPDF